MKVRKGRIDSISSIELFGNRVYSDFDPVLMRLPEPQNLFPNKSNGLLADWFTSLLSKEKQATQESLIVIVFQYSRRMIQIQRESICLQ
jgi:hypothetical protein